MSTRITQHYKLCIFFCFFFNIQTKMYITLYLLKDILLSSPPPLKKAKKQKQQTIKQKRKRKQTVNKVKKRENKL